MVVHLSQAGDNSWSQAGVCRIKSGGGEEQSVARGDRRVSAVFPRDSRL